MSHIKNHVLTLTALGLAVLAFSAPVEAQNTERGNFSFSFGGNSPFMFSGPGAMRGPAKLGAIDPAQRCTAGLLLRNDVRTELVLSAKQREDIEALDKGDNAAPKPLRFEFQEDGQRSSQGEMRERIEKQMRDYFSTAIDERNKKAEEPLKPQQLKRLNEIDVQWRGPLALMDPKLGEKLELTPAQVIKIRDLYQEYRNAQSKAMSEAMRDFMETQEDNDSNDGEERRRIGIRVRIPNEKDLTPEQKARFEKRDKDIEEARKAAGEKVLPLLTPVQKQKWQTLQGKKFTFRTVD